MCQVVHDKEFYERTIYTLQRIPDENLIIKEGHFKTLSLDELRSPDFNLLSDQEYSEEDEAEAMAETMVQYMSKTRIDYGSGVARPKIDKKDQFELKGQFLKELRENTFSGSDNEDANEHIEKVLEIVDLFHLTGEETEEFNNYQQESDETFSSIGAALMNLDEVASRMLKYFLKWHNGTSIRRSTETSDGLAAIQAQLNNLGREIKKVNGKVYATQVGCEQCKGPYYTKDCPQKEEEKTPEEAYYTQFGGPFQGGGYRATTLGYYQRNNANPLYQERRQSMEDTLSKFMSESAMRHKENSNLIKKIRATTNDERGFRSLPSSTETNLSDQVKSIYTTIEADSHLIRRIGSSQYAVSTGHNNTLLYKSRQTTVPFPSHLDNHYCEEEEGNHEKDPRSFTLPCFINDVCFDNALVDLGASVSVMPFSTYLNLGLGELAHTRLTMELADRTVKYPKGIAKNVLVGIGKFTFPVDFVILDMPENIKVPLILGRPFLSTARAKIDVYKRKITLRVGEEKIIFKTRLMGETLVLNRSLDPFFEDYIELNDLNEPFELRRNQGDDLMPTIEEGEVIEEFRTRDEDLDTGIDDYPSYCDDDKKIHIDCAHNLKFSCMIGFEFTHVNFYPLLYVNVMSKEFHNSIMKDKMVYKGDNVVGALMNVPIFVGTLFVMTDFFAVLEDMDAYRDEGMGDIIVGEPFLREVRIKAKSFEGIITLYNGDDEVTYQLVRSHLRFKNHTNEECNKIPPLLKISEKDVKNGISHAYQKLKGFYKGALNLGPDYI
ncbi:hypothetical protein Tco_1093307 [Tanacetum coccineum]|uniref:Reverse transcriptase domain-containing protein n=1 Tax=Tanacetum coccineum TaxID=301880 RepID=A0ABQ5IDM1_9ASTR